MVVSEEWRCIPSWPGLYEASSLGRIRSVPRLLTRTASRNPNGTQTRTYGGRVLSPKVGRGGYLYVSLWADNKPSMRAVHRLVCEAFHGESSLDCNHLDGVRSHNEASNLEWLSRRDNLMYSKNVLGREMAWDRNKRMAEERRNVG